MRPLSQGKYFLESFSRTSELVFIMLFMTLYSYPAFRNTTTITEPMTQNNISATIPESDFSTKHQEIYDDETESTK